MNKTSEFLFLESTYRNLAILIQGKTMALRKSMGNIIILGELERAKHDLAIIEKKMSDVGNSILDEIEREDDVKFKFLKNDNSSTGVKQD